MTIQSAHKILSVFDIRVVLEKSSLKDDRGYYQNYTQITKENGVWQYGTFVFERVSNPHFRPETNFENESAAAKYFLMKKLKSYSVEKFPVITRGYSELESVYLNFDIEKLKNVMQKINIPNSYFVYGVNIADAMNSVHLFESDNGLYKFTIIRNKKQINTPSRAMELWEAAFHCISAVYCYYMYDTEIAPILEKHGVLDEITDDDFLVYIW